jgi:hypothetical protein
MVVSTSRSSSRLIPETWRRCLRSHSHLACGPHSVGMLAFGVCVAAEDTCSRLLHHVFDQRHHRVELLAQAFEHQLLQDGPRALRSSGDLFAEPLRLPHHTELWRAGARGARQSGVPRLHPERACRFSFWRSPTEAGAGPSRWSLCQGPEKVNSPSAPASRPLLPRPTSAHEYHCSPSLCRSLATAHAVARRFIELRELARPCALE